MQWIAQVPRSRRLLLFPQTFPVLPTTSFVLPSSIESPDFLRVLPGLYLGAPGFSVEL